MTHPIETHREPNGDWVATVNAVPGLQVYEGTEAETLASAEKLAAIFMEWRKEIETKILAFYPGAIPDSACCAGRPAGGSAEQSSA